VSNQSFVRRFTSVGGATLVSRGLGLVRELLLSRYLGVGADAFLVAFRIPNLLRHIFVEGALSAALVPTVVQAERSGTDNQASRLVSTALVIFESFVLLMCALIVVKAAWVVKLIAPGFDAARVAQVVPMLQVLIFLIFFLSTNAVFAGALHARNYFFVPAIAPAILNVAFIGGTIFAMWQGLGPIVLAYILVFGGLVQLFVHTVSYKLAGYKFALPNKQTWRHMATVFAKLGPAILGMSIFEINLLLDNQFASTLPEGSISLLHYATRFMGVPLGVFSIAFATVLLPYFARAGVANVERLRFYFTEAVKTVFWVTLPGGMLMALVSDKIFTTLYLSSYFSLANAHSAQCLLLIFLGGLTFLSLNKIMMSMFYALNDTSGPLMIACVGIATNLSFNWLLIKSMGMYGLALATTLSAVAQMTIGLMLLRRRHGVSFLRDSLGGFTVRATAQVVLFVGLFYFLYHGVVWLVNIFCTQRLALILTDTVCFWLWIAPLAGVIWGVILLTRHRFGLRQYFIDDHGVPE
jgi:putative peptidoglycan lipid II flippase